jgi:hypothetical protein
MLIEVRTNGSVEGAETLSDHVKTIVLNTLSRFEGRIRRVDVHLSDVVSNKSSHDDKRCMMEARLEGGEPIAVTQQATSIDKAVHDTVHTLKRSIESALGRQSTLEQKRDHR